ncbi:ligand-binding sensor domain-containing protein [Aquimarina litoralis]|uniref:ligand-binding sensor domain-containing protein n=1 Tax=Aquimarina litoralis TaxID=584605 RepID=UPI001C5645AC
MYQNFTTNNGLSSSEVYDIVQDQKGILWFATDRGLTSYDGYEFQKYTLKEGLTDIVIFNFYEQPNGIIWCSTFNKKLFFFNPNEKLFREFQYNYLLEHIPINFTINDIQIDQDNTLFITFKGLAGYVEIDKNGTYKNTLSIVEGDSITHYKINIDKNSNSYFTLDKAPISSNDVIYLKSRGNGYYGVIRKKNENIFVATLNKKVFMFDVNQNKQQLDQSNNIIISGELDDEHFWIGLQHEGIKIYNYKGELVDHLLKDKSVTKIIKDHEGGIWLSTLDSGVFYIENPFIKIYNSFGTNQNVLKLTNDKENNLYISFHNGEVYQYADGNFTFLCKSYDNYRANVQYYERDDKLLVSSIPDFWHKEIDSSLSKKILFDHGKIISDNSNRTPILGGVQFFKIYASGKKERIVKKIVSKRIHDIEYSNDGYYLATFDGLFEYKNDSLQDLRDQHPLFDNRLEDIDYADDKYYMASMGAGLIIKSKDTIISINKSEGLNSNLANQVHIENKEVYVATNSGLNKIVFNDKCISSITGLSTANGLPSNEVNDIEVIGDTVWVATKNGLCSVPKKLLSGNSTLVTNHWLSIDSVRVNNFRKDSTLLRELPYNNNSITINYKAISFKKESEILYRYRLMGLEEDWNVTQNKEIKYPELPPGSYTFELQSKLKSKDWNPETKKLYVKIIPPFWKTWWFKFLTIVVFSGIIYSFFRFRILLYNRDVIRELLRVLLKRIKGESHYIIIKESGKDIKLNTSHILYFKSSGNYLEIHTLNEKHLIRAKIGEYEKQIPDRLEFVRVHRSYLVRIDKVQTKSLKFVQINDEDIPVGKTYKSNLDKIVF